MPSLEEKMHVSSIMLDNLDRLTSRLELAYEVAIKNTEIPRGLRLGVDNHPAMHLHHELMEKIESKSKQQIVAGTEERIKKRSHGCQQEAGRTLLRQHTPTRRLKRTNANYGGNRHESQDHTGNNTNSRKRANAANTNNADPETKNARGELPPTAVSPSTISTATAVNNGRIGTSTASRGVSSVGNSNNSRISRPKTNDYGEPLYCYCNQVAYGEMVGCDGADCELEWFHLPCIGLETLT